MRHAGFARPVNGASRCSDFKEETKMAKDKDKKGKKDKKEKKEKKAV